MFFAALSWLYQVTSQTNGRVAQWVSDSYWKARTVHSSVIVLLWGRKRMGPGSGVENATVMKPVTLFCYFFLLPSLEDCALSSKIHVILNLLTKRNVALVLSCQNWWKKTEDRFSKVRQPLQHSWFHLWRLPAFITLFLYQGLYDHRSWENKQASHINNLSSPGSAQSHQHLSCFC